MTDNKRTIGPWFIMPDGLSVADKHVWFDESGARHGETPNMIIRCDNHEEACLIAAAPELLAALRPFAECVEQIADNESDEEWAKFRLIIKEYRAAAAAIARAEGR